MHTDSTEVIRFKIKVVNYCKVLLLLVFAFGMYQSNQINNRKNRTYVKSSIISSGMDFSKANNMANSK